MADSLTLVFKGSDPVKVIFFPRLLYQLNFVSVLNTQHLVGALGWNLRSHDPGDRARNGSAGLSGDEARVMRYTQESLRHHNISDSYLQRRPPSLGHANNRGKDWLNGA
jgi:hypothetical protein